MNIKYTPIYLLSAVLALPAVSGAADDLSRPPLVAEVPNSYSARAMQSGNTAQARAANRGTYAGMGPAAVPTRVPDSAQSSAPARAPIQAAAPVPQPAGQALVQAAMPAAAVTYQQRRAVQVAAAVNPPGSAHVINNIQEGKINGVHTITAMYGENHRIPVAKNYPNIITTPFVQARAVGLNQDYDLGDNGSALLVTPKTNKPFFLSITDAQNPTLTPISLTLVPQTNLDSQTIVVSLGGRSVGSDRPTAGGGFSQQLAAVIKDIVMLKTPSGYSVRPLQHTFAMANGMAVAPVERYSGAEFDVYRYRLHNRSQGAQTLAEEMFGADARVVAVAFYPKITLNPGESTDVLIMTGKAGAQ